LIRVLFGGSTRKQEAVCGYYLVVHDLDDITDADLITPNNFGLKCPIRMKRLALARLCLLPNDRRRKLHLITLHIEHLELPLGRVIVLFWRD
jgi:hypothetical protein